MANKIIQDPHDAPPVTYSVLREMKERIYELENRLAYNTSDQRAGNKGVDATTQALSEQVKNLSARIAVSDLASTVSTGVLPNDATFHNYGTPASVQVTVPEGCQIIAQFGASQATVDVNGTGAGVLAEIVCYVYDEAGSTLLYGGNNAYASRFYSSLDSESIGGPLAMSVPILVPPGNYQVRAQVRAWASGTTAATVTVATPFVTVQITGRS